MAGGQSGLPQRRPPLHGCGGVREGGEGSCGGVRVRVKGARRSDGERQWQAVNPVCPNAANPFDRCAEYYPVPVPKVPLPPRGYEGSTHSDPGATHLRPRRRDKGGSGGLPLYVFHKLSICNSGFRHWNSLSMSKFRSLRAAPEKSHLCACVSQCAKVPMATGRRWIPAAPMRSTRSTSAPTPASPR